MLPGTLSTRTYLKQANVRAQTALSEWAEPLSVLAPPQTPGLLRHAWELAVQNSPHDSVCGCSVDEVHAQNMVRAQRAAAVGEQLLARGLLAQGVDVRVHGDPAVHEVSAVVLDGTGTATGGPVVLEVTTAPDRWVTGVTGPDGQDLPVEVEDLGTETMFEADLDLLPDSRPVRRHRLALVAPPVPGLGWARLRVRLGDRPTCAPAAAAAVVGQEVSAPDGRSLAVRADASFTVVDGTGRTWEGLSRLVDGGDAGDSYTYEPPVRDELVPAGVVGVRALVSAVRTRVVVDVVLDLPVRLSPDRTGRSPQRAPLPVRVEATLWAGQPELHVRVDGDNRAQDHRLRLHVAVPDRHATTWDAEAHWSTQRRPLGPPLGPLPTEPGLEAPIGVAPVHGWARCGAGDDAVALLPRGLPEVQGLEPDGERGPELAVALLRAVGWLSRFDLRARTAGAGPMLATPDAQVPGPFRAEVALRLGADAADDLALAAAADRWRAPLRGLALRPGTDTAAPRSAPVVEVDGGRLSALKPAEDGDGVILRVANPTGARVVARVASATAPAEEVRLDESAVGAAPAAAAGVWEIPLEPFAVRSFRIRR